MDSVSSPSLEDVNRFLRLHPRLIDSFEAPELLINFVTANLDPTSSPNLKNKNPDDLSNILYLLGLHRKASGHFVQVLLSALRILLRKEANRTQLGHQGVKIVVGTLCTPHNTRVAIEGSNVVLNMCYDSFNAQQAIHCGGLVPLISYLEMPDVAVQASASGALQSICYQKLGRLQVRELGGIPPLVRLIRTGDIKAMTSSVGALHNISSDTQSIASIRSSGAIPLLIKLLSSSNEVLCSSAAGTLQNISREASSRVAIYKYGAAGPLSNLLFGSSVHAQVCAAGALLNIIGPGLLEKHSNKRVRDVFKRIISSSIAIGCVYSAIYI